MTRLPCAAVLAVWLASPVLDARADPLSAAPPATTIAAEPEPGPDLTLQLSLDNGYVSSLGWGVGFGVGVEKTIGHHVALDLGVHLQHDDEGVDMYDGVGLRVAPHFYLRGVGKSGPFIAPFATLAYDRAGIGGRSAGALGESLGALVGWSAQLGRFDLRVGVGAEVDNLAVDVPTPGGTFTRGARGFNPAFELGLGIRL